MFAKDNKKRPASDAPSLLSADLKVKGDLDSEGDIQIDGVVHGDVRARSVTVGQGANVIGEIVAETVVVVGKIEGRIQARNVTLRASAEIVGDVHHDAIEVDKGAKVNGALRPLDAKAANEKPRPVLTEAAVVTL